MSKINVLLFFSSVVFFACEIKPFQEGERLYKAYCANCHMDDGKGLKGLIPPLAEADFLSRYQEQIPCIIRFGIKGEIIVNGKKYDTEMAGIQELTDIQINNIINYIYHSWNNDLGMSNIKDVKLYLKKCN